MTGHPGHGDGNEPARPPAEDSVRIWAAPGVITDPERPELGEFATLTVVSSVSAYTADPTPGADPVDVLLSGLLARGYALLPALNVEEFLALPVLEHWTVHHHADGVLHVAEPAGVFYLGDLGAAAPPRWEPSLRQRGWLVVLVCAGVDLHRPDRNARIVRAIRRGNVIAAQIPLADSARGPTRQGPHW